MRNSSGSPGAGNYEFLGFGGAYGMFQDPDTGLVYCRDRWYDPLTKQFLSPDPLGSLGSGQTNVYAYAGNDPVNHADPDGTDRIEVVGRGGRAYEVSGSGGAASLEPVGSMPGVQVLWRVERPGDAPRRSVASIPIGLQTRGGVLLHDRFGGRFVQSGVVESAAQSVFKQNRDLSGLTREEQERAIKSAIDQAEAGGVGGMHEFRFQVWLEGHARAAAHADQQEQMANDLARCQVTPTFTRLANP